MSTRHRKYGADHTRARRVVWAPVVDRGDAVCCLCGEAILPGTPWDLDHMPGTNEYRGAAHAHCNRRDGAVRGNRQRGLPSTPTRWAL